MFFATQVKSDFSLLWKRRNWAKKTDRYKGLVWVPSKLFSEFVMETETILRPAIPLSSYKDATAYPRHT